MSTVIIADEVCMPDWVNELDRPRLRRDTAQARLANLQGFWSVGAIRSGSGSAWASTVLPAPGND